MKWSHAFEKSRVSIVGIHNVSLEAILEQWDDQQSYKHINAIHSIEPTFGDPSVKNAFRVPLLPQIPNAVISIVSFLLNDGTWQVPQVEALLLLPQFAYFSVFGF